MSGRHARRVAAHAASPRRVNPAALLVVLVVVLAVAVLAALLVLAPIDGGGVW